MSEMSHSERIVHRVLLASDRSGLGSTTAYRYYNPIRVKESCLGAKCLSLSIALKSKVGMIIVGRMQRQIQKGPRACVALSLTWITHLSNTEGARDKLGLDEGGALLLGGIANILTCECYYDGSALGGKNDPRLSVYVAHTDFSGSPGRMGSGALRGVHILPELCIFVNGVESYFGW